MAPRYLNRPQLKRLNPFEGLMIDAAAWADAHRYHQDQQRLHALALHQSGIVAGLAVPAHSPSDQSVIIHPGIAIDPEGNIILVGQAQRYYLQPKERATVYLIIEFREVPADRASYDGEQPTRILEAYRIQQRDSLPDEPHIELARCRIEAIGQPVQDARDTVAPGPNEIDGRFRHQVTVRPQGELSIGLLVPKAGGVMTTSSQQGLRNLERELRLQCAYQALFRGAVELGRDASDCALLYMAGNKSFSFDQYELTALAAFLEGGGVVLGEACNAEGTDSPQGGGFVIGFKVLAERLGCRLKPVERGHAILDARYPFGMPPEGTTGGGEFLEGGGMIFSALDYGCAWAGGHSDQPLRRGTIRDALELGVNVAAYAEIRRRSAALRQSSL